MNVSVHLALFVKETKVGNIVVFAIAFLAVDVIISLNLTFRVFIEIFFLVLFSSIYYQSFRE